MEPLSLLVGIQIDVATVANFIIQKNQIAIWPRNSTSVYILEGNEIIISYLCPSPIYSWQHYL